MNLQPYVRISNGGRQSAEIHLIGCPLSLRMYPDPYREEPPVWNGARFREQAGGCMQEDFIVTISPGQSYEVADEIDPTIIFDDSVPEGRYRFSVVLSHVNRAPMQLGVWYTFLSRGAGGLVFTTETKMVDVAPRKLEVAVTVTNVGSEQVSVAYGPCPVRLRAHQRSHPAEGPVWEEPDRGCSDSLAVTDLASGESARPKEFQRRVDEPEILGDSLNDGQYVIAAMVTVNGGSTDVAASQAYLVRAQSPLPSARIVEGFRYEASPIVLSGSSTSINSDVTITDINGSRATQVARCPVLLYAFRDHATRDIAFTGDEPDWGPQEHCTLDMEDRLFQPDGTIRLETIVAVSELRKTADAGHYYFVAVVPAPGTRVGGAVVLSAGEANIPE